MSKAFFVALMLAATSTIGAVQAEPVLAKGLRIDSLDEQFTETADKVGAPDFWARKVTCSMNVKATCRYSFEGNIGLIAVAAKESGEAESMMLLFAGDSDPASFLITLGLMATVIEPKMTKDGRVRLIKTLMDGLKEGEDSEARTKVATYKRNSNSVTGTVISVEPR